MATPSLPGPPSEHRQLRSALEFAVAIADAGHRLKPPLPSPPELRTFAKHRRLPGGALGRVRRLVESAPEFRQRLAVAATDEFVDALGREWLRREPGWEERVRDLETDASAAQAEADQTAELKRSERRRQAAEAVAARTRAELAVLDGQLAERVVELDRCRAELVAERAGQTAHQGEVAAARQAARHAADRAAADRARLDAVTAERDAALRRVEVAERQRDELLVARAERSGVAVSAAQLGDLQALAESARRLAARLGALTDVPVVPRVPVTVPGRVAGDVAATAEYLLRVREAVTFVDGYNVAKRVWPDLSLEQQRERCLDAVDAVARRFGSELVVVFDGADVVGAHSAHPRMARVRYSPAGTIADDIIRAEVAGVDPARPVVVVTNDNEIRRDVAQAGANVVSSEAFATVALR